MSHVTVSGVYFGTFGFLDFLDLWTFGLRGLCDVGTSGVLDFGTFGLLGFLDLMTL